MQLHCLDDGRPAVEPVQADGRTRRARELADDDAIADQHRQRMPGVGPVERAGDGRQLGDLGGDEITLKAAADRLIGDGEPLCQSETKATTMTQRGDHQG